MTIFNALLPVFTEYGYVAVFTVLLSCGFGLPLPEDIILVAGGVIAGLGFANEHWMVIVGLAGVLIGDGVTFRLGQAYGQRMPRSVLDRFLTPVRTNKVRRMFERYGNRLMFIARFLPGLRTPVFFTAGMTRAVSFADWLFMDGMAALVSVPVCVYLGVFGARNFEQLFSMVDSGRHIVWGALLLCALVTAALWWRRR